MVHPEDHKVCILDLMRSHNDQDCEDESCISPNYRPSTISECGVLESIQTLGNVMTLDEIFDQETMLTGLTSAPGLLQFDKLAKCVFSEAELLDLIARDEVRQVRVSKS